MAGKPVALILGDDAGIGRCVRTMGFRPIVAELPDAAVEAQQRLSPALVLVNLPNGSLTPRLLRRLSRPGIPLLLMRDAADPIPDPEDQQAPLYVLRRPVSRPPSARPCRTPAPTPPITQTGHSVSAISPSTPRF